MISKDDNNMKLKTHLDLIALNRIYNQYMGWGAIYKYKNFYQLVHKDFKFYAENKYKF